MINSLDQLYSENKNRKLQIFARIELEKLYVKKEKHPFDVILQQSILRSLYRETGIEKYSRQLANEFGIEFSKEE